MTNTLNLYCRKCFKTKAKHFKNSLVFKSHIPCKKSCVYFKLNYIFYLFERKLNSRILFFRQQPTLCKIPQNYKFIELLLKTINVNNFWHNFCNYKTNFFYTKCFQNSSNKYSNNTCIMFSPKPMKRKT